MLVDFCTLAASYAAWNHTCLADAVLWYATLDAREPCRAEVPAAPLYDTRAARIRRALDDAEDGVVVLLRGLSTHEQYALCESGSAPILGPSCVSQTFREVLSARVHQATRQLKGTIRSHCVNAALENAQEWSAEMALSAATRAPCCLFLPNNAALADALLEALQDTVRIVQLDLADGAADLADCASDLESDRTPAAVTAESKHCEGSGEHLARFLHRDFERHFEHAAENAEEHWHAAENAAENAAEQVAEEQAPFLAPADAATQAWGESARKRKRRKWRYAFFASSAKKS